MAAATNHGGDQHHDNGNHGGGYRGPAVVYAQPDYNYYAPQPDYYAQPEPYNYYGDSPEYPAAPPQGVTLFFGL